MLEEVDGGTGETYVTFTTIKIFRKNIMLSERSQSEKNTQSNMIREECLCADIEGHQLPGELRTQFLQF